ncbi:predicted protein [Nematostella vectensis]|uniref:Agmatine deiminase n=1 Tax=Nematostella vectensis TaxID=45351 RepID=A7SR61_NEMVE|nr:uncharacterized protein LOC5505045 [Nematostella vectensis]EDO33816.1 predicted protein [Nematostella vectensis]|eukprot:XP_001625916.1 predicted protein [Nematostella vectensis]
MANAKQTIVISLPGKKDNYYVDDIKDIADFVFEMDKQTYGHDNLIVIHDKSGRNLLKQHEFVNAQMIEIDEPGLDLWMRDFPPCMPKQQVKFSYKPQYIKASRATHDASRFDKFAVMVGLPQWEKSDLVLEGGNIVENGEDIAIVTERIFDDNKKFSEKEVIRRVEQTIKRKVVVVPDPEDTTGHADGIVSFLDKNTLLITMLDDKGGKDFYEDIKKEVTDSYPHLKIIPLPSYSKKTKKHGFNTAEGSYANSLVTYNAVYVPCYGNHKKDEMALGVIQSCTSKAVIPIRVRGRVPELGGSVRCMTWQIDESHPVARRLAEYVTSSPSPLSPQAGSSHGRH